MPTPIPQRVPDAPALAQAIIQAIIDPGIATSARRPGVVDLPDLIL